VRGVAIGAIGDLVGAVLFVIGIDRAVSWLIALGVVLFVFASGLLTAALLVRLRIRTTVLLDTDTITIRSGGRSAQAQWSQITRVQTDGRTIYLRLDPGATGQIDAEALKIDSPRGDLDPQFRALADDLTRSLDHDRGYQSL
jgi:hypothetical protein